MLSRSRDVDARVVHFIDDAMTDGEPESGRTEHSSDYVFSACWSELAVHQRYRGRSYWRPTPAWLLNSLRCRADRLTRCTARNPSGLFADPQRVVLHRIARRHICPLVEVQQGPIGIASVRLPGACGPAGPVHPGP
jgi:hypothetical protein